MSAASIWEIAIKLSIGKLRWRGEPTLEESVAASGFEELPITVAHASLVRRLPLHHADPFDRLLVAQALSEGLVVVTAHDAFGAYGVRTLSAG